jgi:hypothetical protein
LYHEGVISGNIPFRCGWSSTPESSKTTLAAPSPTKVHTAEDGIMSISLPGLRVLFVESSALRLSRCLGPLPRLPCKCRSDGITHYRRKQSPQSEDQRVEVAATPSGQEQRERGKSTETGKGRRRRGGGRRARSRMHEVAARERNVAVTRAVVRRLDGKGGGTEDKLVSVDQSHLGPATTTGTRREGARCEK